MTYYSSVREERGGQKQEWQHHHKQKHEHQNINSCHNYQDHSELKSTKITTRFKVNEILGKGAFATVYRATRRNNLDQYRRSNTSSSNGTINSIQNSTSNNGKTYHRPDETVSLKIVNVSRVVKRRLERKSLGEEVGSGQHGRHDDNGGIRGRNLHEGEKEKACKKSLSFSLSPQLTSLEYNTEELFFPSRIEKKNKMGKGNDCNDCNANANDNNDYENEDDFVATMNLLQREISVHSNISKHRHPNIVSMLESFQYDITSGTGSKGGKDLIVSMVIEYCPFGDLHQYLKRKRDENKRKMGNMSSNVQIDNNQDYHCTSMSTFLEEKEVQHAMRHILRGLAFLHSHGIVHRDIKAGNILLSMAPSSNPCLRKSFIEEEKNISSFTLFDCCLKIGDFGLAVQMSDDDDWDDAQHTLCGTPSCLAPEVALSTPQTTRKRSPHSKLNNQHESLYRNRCGERNSLDEDIRGHGQPADLWSVGCLLYVMLIGKYPFSTANKMVVQELVAPDKFVRMRETIEKVVQGEWSVPQNISISKAADGLLSQLLSYDPKRRGFARGLLSTHSFFQQIKLIRDEVEDNDESVTCLTNMLTSATSFLMLQKRKLPLGDINTNHSSLQQRGYDKKSNVYQRANKSIDSTNCIDSAHRKLPKKKSGKRMAESFVNPIKDLHLLPVMKHQWEAAHCNRSIPSQTKKIKFTVFVLPERNGLVFQCEKFGGSGAWMHIAEDGERISMGKLARTPVSFNESNGKKDNMSLLYEAFSRRPKKFKHVQHIPFSGTIASGRTENQSLYTIGPIHNTIYSTPSTNSVPVLANNHIVRTKYKKLSCLLQKKNRTFLSLYRKLDKFVRELKNSTPKIHLDIYGCDKSKTDRIQVGSLLCTVAFIECPKCFIMVTFVDGFKIRYDTSTGFAQIHTIGNDKKRSEGVVTIFLQSKKIMSQIQEKGLGEDKSQSFGSYLQFARSAIKKCIEIERQCSSEVKSASKYIIPQRRKLVVKGKSYRSWVDITNISPAEQQDLGYKVESILNRKLIDETLELTSR